MDEKWDWERTGNIKYLKLNKLEHLFQLPSPFIVHSTLLR